MSNSRRFEILPPLKFNDGQPVPWEFWRHQQAEFRDDLVRIFVDVEDRAEYRQFFREYKGKLKTRFRQIDVWMTTHPIEII